MRFDDDADRQYADASVGAVQPELFPPPVNDIGDMSTARAAQFGNVIGPIDTFPGRRADDAALRRISATPHRRATDGAGAAGVAAAPKAWAHRPQKDRAAFFELHFHPLLIVDRAGRVLDANSAARRDITEGSIGVGANGALRLGARECARRLHAVLVAPAPDANATAWTRLVLRMSDGEWRLVRTRPMPGVHDVALIEIQPSVSDQDADLSPLAQAFALTAAETAVLANLLEAQAPKEIARSLKISSHTVRAHMRAIYAKLGVRARSGMMKAVLRLVS